MQLTPLSHQEGGVRPQLKDLLLQVAADGGHAEVLGAVGSVEAAGAVTVDHRDSTGHAGPGGVGAGGDATGDLDTVGCTGTRQENGIHTKLKQLAKQ